ncbi:MAG TPA: tyrosine-type recombinase/integrase [Gemmataceae bacterium]|nr:tyrosine-type recombinase/integrase [Gemmataceae bacterium]
MNLRRLIEQYVVFQQSLGAKFRSNAQVLRAFGNAVGAATDIADVRAEQVDAFLLGKGVRTSSWHTKLYILRPFYHYAVTRGYVGTPPLPSVVPKRPPPFVPYIYSNEDLRRLLEAADAERPPHLALDSATLRTVLLLLYGAGLRAQEALNLNRADVDLDNSLLTIRQTKFGKSRLVPVGSQLCRALAQYAGRVGMSRADDPFFTTRSGARVKYDWLSRRFRLLCQRVGIRRTDDSPEQPRLHDLRHSFAVHRLTAWYREGADVQRLLHHLSVYLGHAHLANTQVYLTMTPELLQQANVRFERYARGEDGHA